MTRPPGSPQIRRAYDFLQQAERDDRVFTKADLSAASTWSPKTTAANCTKKLSRLLVKTGPGYQCAGVVDLPYETFARMCSQSAALADNPRDPRYPVRVEGLINKAREAALAAVQHYNNPTSLFRSGNFIVLMTIAFTALLHAVFERRGTDYRDKDRSGNPVQLPTGLVSLWNLVKSVHEYEQNPNSPIVKNIEFLYPIRGRIEHQFMPQLDAVIMGHCHALLMNFEKILGKEFGNYYALNTSLVFPMYISSERPKQAVDALTRFQNAEYQAVKDLIDEFYKNTDRSILTSQEFSFCVYLFPRAIGKDKPGIPAIEYVPVEHLEADEVARVEQSIVAMKYSPHGQPPDLAETYPLTREDVLQQLHNTLGDVRCGREHPRRPTGEVIKRVIAAHKLTSLGGMYYRPKTKKSVPMTYSQRFVDWLVREYRDDERFFEEAWEKGRAGGT